VSFRVKDARKFLEKHKRLDYAIDAYYNDPLAIAATARRQADISAPSTSKLNTLFDKYKGALACPDRVSSMLSLT
jgi:DCN1-like protein 1/2